MFVEKCSNAPKVLDYFVISKKFQSRLSSWSWTIYNAPITKWTSLSINNNIGSLADTVAAAEHGWHLAVRFMQKDVGKSTSSARHKDNVSLLSK